MAGATVAVKNAILNQVVRGTDYTIAAGTHLSLHTNDPGDNGANEATGGSYARQAATFSAASSAELALSGAVTFSGLASGTYTHIGVWTASSGGTFLMGGTVPAKVNPDNYLVTTGTKITI